MNKILLVKPSLSDVDTMVQWGEANKWLHFNDKGEYYTRRDLWQWIKNPKGHLIRVAKIDGNLAGMCLTYFLHGMAYCDTLYVFEAYRRKGIGKKLLAQAMAHAKRKGIKMFILLVNTQNETAQIFYKKMQLDQGYAFYAMEKNL